MGITPWPGGELSETGLSLVGLSGGVSDVS